MAKESLNLASANREYKDSVFTKLFSETDKLLELYNALTGENYGSDTEIEINTLEGVLFLDRMNDISFSIGRKRVILIEHMSSISENLPLRCLMYIARLYEKSIEKETIYRKKLVKIPAPEFIVLYNGKDEFPEEKTLRLSDGFHEIPERAIKYGSLELVIRVLNINHGHNNEIVKKSDTLQGYVLFVEQVRKGTNAGLELATAITEAIKHCKEHGILQPFLTEHGSEVINMLFTEFNIDTAKKIWQEEAREDGLEAGRKKGHQEGRKEGRKEGRQEGRKEGRLEGHKEGNEEAIMRVLALLETGQSLDELKKQLHKECTPQ
jgi:hypothetical protein